MTRATQGAPPSPAERDEWLHRHLLEEPEPPEGEHLTTDELLDYAFERCPTSDVERFDRHLEDCEACADDLDAILAVSGPWLGPLATGAADTAPRYAVVADRASPRLLAGLAAHLGSEDALPRVAVLEVVDALGERAADRAFLAPVCTLLMDWERDAEVRATAAEALGKIGPKAATVEVLAALEKSIADGPEELQEAAAYAVGSLGAGAASGGIQTRLGILAERDPDEAVGTAAAWSLASLGSAVADERLIDTLLRLLGHQQQQMRRLAGQFLREVPKAGERFRQNAKQWLQARTEEITGLVAPDPSTLHAGGQVWPQSGTLAGGRISYEFQPARDGERDVVDLRFGSRILDLENAVLTIDAIPASAPNAARTEATISAEPNLWFVVLGKRGRDEVGARVRIPWRDLPTGSPFGVELRVRVID
jgi:hypothetical protein